MAPTLPEECDLCGGENSDCELCGGTNRVDVFEAAEYARTHDDYVVMTALGEIGDSD